MGTRASSFSSMRSSAGMGTATVSKPKSMISAPACCDDSEAFGGENCASLRACGRDAACAASAAPSWWWWWSC